MYRIVSILIGLVVSSMALANSDRDWSKVINNATDSIVTIRVDAVRAFDTSLSHSSQATGFVVDAQRGIILTNRHVVQSGPVTAEAIFSNREEIELKPIYRDPVHDFGFFQYDPKLLKFIKPKSLSINPQQAIVGSEIRVVGNDAGEQLSILAGTLARIDRQAPYYGRGRYNDFNTFYYQSASGVSGGSSGSPVLNIQGNVIALNAGGSVKASSSYFLPLQRVKRALKLIQENKAVSRGSLQTTFDYKPYDEVRRLGLRAELEAEFRKVNHGVGLLVVRRSLPDTDASKKLKPGDILIKGAAINETLTWIRGFEELEDLLDSHVNKKIKLLVERSGQSVEIEVQVDDLHELTPDKYLTFGQAIVHNLSYQQARHLNRPVEGVYVAQAGYILSSAGVPRGAVILSINNQTVKNIDDVELILNELADGQQVALQYITFKAPNRTHVSVMRMDRRWFALQKCHRDDSLSYWPCESLANNVAEEKFKKAEVKFIEYKDERANRLSSAIVSVQFDVPYNVSGVEESHYNGAGLIIDKKAGLVLVDRNTVPMSLGDVRVVFAGVFDVPAEVVFVHPLHNVAIVKYDPALLINTDVSEIELDDKKLEIGDEVWLVALKNEQDLLVEKTIISAIESLEFATPKIPKFRESNLDAISLNNAPLSRGGVLSDKEGRVVAIWSSFAYSSNNKIKQYEWGIPAKMVIDLLDQWHCCQRFEIRSLNVELTALSIAQAKKLGLSEKWSKQFQSSDYKRQVLAVSKRMGANNKLQEGDLLLSINGDLVRNYSDVESAANKESVLIGILRQGKELSITMNTEVMDGAGLSEVFQWAGALIQEPYRELVLQQGVDKKGVYVSYVFHGGPANRSNLSALLRIVEMNGNDVFDLASFKQLAGKYKNDKFIQLKVLDLIDRESVISLKQNQYYWPARSIYKKAGKWISE